MEHIALGKNGRKMGMGKETLASKSGTAFLGPGLRATARQTIAEESEEHGVELAESAKCTGQISRSQEGEMGPMPRLYCMGPIVRRIRRRTSSAITCADTEGSARTRQLTRARQGHSRERDRHQENLSYLESHITPGNSR